MKRLFIFLATFTAAFLIATTKQVCAECVYRADLPGCGTAEPRDCTYDQDQNRWYKISRIDEDLCTKRYGKPCAEAIDPRTHCLLVETWTADCGGCLGGSPNICEVPGVSECRSKEDCYSARCCLAHSGDYTDCAHSNTSTTCCCSLECMAEVSCTDAGGVCVAHKDCPLGSGIALPTGRRSWIDCNTNFGFVCCEVDAVTSCSALGGLCMPQSACTSPNRVLPRPPSGVWDDCLTTYPPYEPDPNLDCCLPAKLPSNSCYQQGGICTKKDDCDAGNTILRPAGDWAEEECKASNGGVCCRVDLDELGCEHNVKDPHRETVACGRFFLEKTKNWSSTYPTRAAAEAARNAIDFYETYDFTGTITIGKKDKDTEGEFTWPIKGDLPRLVGYFPDYKKPDGTYDSPSVIKGAADLANYNFVPGALLRYGPPENADALAAWLPILYKTYAHYIVPVESCIESRTDAAGNPIVPEAHGAVRYTYGLWKTVHNRESKTGIWDWIARRPGEEVGDVINWARGLAARKPALDNLAGQPNPSVPTAGELAEKPSSLATTLVTAREAGLVLGASTTNVGCGYPSCERDGRSAPEYDEPCVWFNGEVVIAGGVEDVHITKDNSNPKISEGTDPFGNPVFTLSYSHTVKVGPIRIDVREGYLGRYWPLKLNFFLSLIPPGDLEGKSSFIFDPPEWKGCKDSCKHTWGNVDLYHSGGVRITSADAADDGGGNLEYLHKSGWAETAEELVMGRQNGSVLGAKISGARDGKVLGTAVGGPGYAIPPSWAELYLPIILKDYGE